MKIKTAFLCTCCFVALTSMLQAGSFDDYFFDKAMRFDFQHAGTATSESYCFEKLVEEPFWAGPKKNLIDPFDYGNQKFVLVDLASGEPIFSRTYCTLFNEWQVTDEAKAGVARAYAEAVLFPFPKNKVRIEFYGRDRDNHFVKRYEQVIDPASYTVEPRRRKDRVWEIVYNGKAEQKVDIVLLPEGYGADEMDVFKADCLNFANVLFTYSPYKENREKFNIRAVWAPSDDSGISIPGEHIWKNTLLGSKFNTFGSERYQTVSDQQKVFEVAGNAPFDFAYILTNTSKYGGGGIFRFYGISAAHHPSAAGKVYVHEFGHQLLGLGDEYVEIGGQAEDLYPLHREPWEENLTTLVDFSKKELWRSCLEKGTPVPTAVTEKNREKVGVYEGGGYVEKGVYRPKYRCMMNEFKEVNTFCPVCEKGIQQMIDFYTK